MIKRYGKWILTAALLAAQISWTNNQLELVAPGGGEMDMEQNLMKYYATATTPVVVRWDDYVLESSYLEYFRSKSILNGRKKVKLTQSKPALRVLKSSEIHLELDRDFYTATGEVDFAYDPVTRLTGGKLEWDQLHARTRISGSPVITFKEWTINGEVIDGVLDKGVFTVTGNVKAFNQDATITAGKLTFERDAELYILQDHPVLVRGQSQLNATEIIYYVKTKKVTAKGLVQSKIIKENQ